MRPPSQLNRRKNMLVSGRLKPGRVTEIIAHKGGGVTRRVYAPAAWERKQAKNYAAAVMKARETAGMSQDDFARFMGVPRGTLRNWEQGHRQPSGPARVLIEVVTHNPDAVLAIIGA